MTRCHSGSSAACSANNPEIENWASWAPELSPRYAPEQLPGDDNDNEHVGDDDAHPDEHTDNSDASPDEHTDEGDASPDDQSDDTSADGDSA